MNVYSYSLIAALVGLAVQSPAVAVLNGDFSAGLVDWTSTGDVAVQSEAAILTTASASFDDDFPALAGAFNVSGLEPAPTGLDLEAALGLAPNAFGAEFTEGSALSQTLTFQAGDVLSFNYQLFTNESASDVTPRDAAFVVLGDSILPLTSFAAASLPSSPFTAQTASDVFQYTFASSGTALFGIVLLDQGDFAVSSALQIDNIALTAIPEPQTYALLVGAAALGFVISRRSRTRLQA